MLTKADGLPVPSKPPEVDPIEEASRYVNQKWFQQLVPIRTACYRCGVDSPVVCVPVGTMAFGNPQIIRKGDRDVTKEVIAIFSEVGWKLQKFKSYCPACKNLGSVP